MDCLNRDIMMDVDNELLTDLGVWGSVEWGILCLSHHVG